MKKAVFMSMLLILLTACVIYSPQFAPTNIIKYVQKHVVAITVAYPNPEAEYSEFVEPYEMYIGSGVIIPGNRILTVAHLLNHGEVAKITAIRPFDPAIITCSIISITDQSDDPTNDYALLSMDKDLKLPGLILAEQDAVIGEKVIFAGTVGGLCITRFGYSTQFKWLFIKRDGKAVLTNWQKDYFLTVYPGGNGDSGGTITNIRGEIVGMMYCGVEIYGESYIFSNPMHRLREFLNK